MKNHIQRNLLTNRLNKYLGRKLETSVKTALNSILENEIESGFKYKLEANLKQAKVMVVRSMRVSYADLFFNEQEASQYVTTFFNTYSSAVVQNYLYKKKYYKTPHDGIVHIPQGEITDYSPNGGVYGFKVNDRYFYWDYSEELYYDLYNRVYSPNGEVVIGVRTPRYIKEAYKKLSEVRIKHPRAYLEHINRYDANEMIINHSNSDGLWGSTSGGFYDGGKDFSTTNFPEPHGVGAYTPVVGSLWDATHDFQDGDYGWAAVNTVMAVSDVFLVNSIRKGIMKGGLKAITMGNAPWWAKKGNSYRNFYGKTGFIQKGQHGHHWLIHQNGRIGKYVPGAFKNQMWNIKPMWPKMHFNAGHGKWYLGSPPMTKVGQFWFGTPIWFKAGSVSGGLRGFENFKRDE